MPRDNLESTLFGRVCQIFGGFMVALALGLTVMDALYAPLAAPINIITLSCGLWCLLSLGPRAVRQARDHKAYMDAHRATMRELGTPWN